VILGTGGIPPLVAVATVLIATCRSIPIVFADSSHASPNMGGVELSLIFPSSPWDANRERGWIPPGTWVDEESELKMGTNVCIIRS
jgi:hypothetical protein